MTVSRINSGSSGHFKRNAVGRLATAIALAGMLAVTGCNTVDRDNAVIGGAAGAAIGGIGTGTLEGAAVGAAVGAGAGVLLGRILNTDRCWYKNRRGVRYIGRCR